MRNFKKIAACAAAIMCAATMAVTSSAKLTVVPSDRLVISSDQMFLVMLYSDGTYDASTKDPADYGVDLTKIDTVEVTVKAGDDFAGEMGGAIIMSSKSPDDASTHNWPSKEYWGVKDDNLEIDTQADKPVKYETVGDHLYKATLKLSGTNTVIENYNFVQFAIQDWGSDIISVESIVMKDASGNEIISFDQNGKANKENIWGKETTQEAEETTEAETEAPAETTAAEETEETKQKTKKTTTEAETEPEEIEVVEDDDEDDDTTIGEDDDADADEEAAEPHWVGAPEGSGTEELEPWLSFDKLAGVPNKPCLILCSEDDNAEPPADAVLDFKVSDIYGFRFYVQVDETAWDNWHGGQIGTNSALGGWATLVDYSTDNDLGNLTIDLDAGTFTYLGDTPLFAQEEQDMGGYAHIWLMDWSNGDDALVTVGVDVLDKNGNNLFDAPQVVVVEEPAPVEETPVVVTGNVEAATDSTKGSPDTGIADVAAVAGIGLLAAGAVVAARKRK